MSEGVCVCVCVCVCVTTKLTTFVLLGQVPMLGDRQKLLFPVVDEELRNLV